MPCSVDEPSYRLPFIHFSQALILLAHIQEAAEEHTSGFHSDKGYLTADAGMCKLPCQTPKPQHSSALWQMWQTTCRVIADSFNGKGSNSGHLDLEVHPQKTTVMRSLSTISQRWSTGKGREEQNSKVAHKP